ncbi:MAG TPA: GatB/YqeY domain-containing protein [Flavobacteriaceae bacterium]|nr:GatB/YqeY domain-containing protein [Flavobacteriaceae bacterium]
MNLQKEVMLKMKEAMLNKNAIALESLRAIKSELLLMQTKSGGGAEISKEDEIKLLQKMVKQRKDSAAVYKEQGRSDLAEPELQQIEIIEQFLPKQVSVDEIKKVVNEIIVNTGATSMKDMGKVMGMASKQLAGKADGKTISTIVKQQLQ